VRGLTYTLDGFEDDGMGPMMERVEIAEERDV
jgi:hypothetical protein